MTFLGKILQNKQGQVFKVVDSSVERPFLLLENLESQQSVKIFLDELEALGFDVLISENKLKQIVEEQVENAMMALSEAQKLELQQALVTSESPLGSTESNSTTVQQGDDSHGV